jgi:hypothetical protein
MKKTIFLFFIFTVLISCNQVNKNCEPWIPVLEKTDFSYLAKAVDKCIELQNNNKTAQLNNQILKLKYYYLPMTEVRQLVYDADRLYYLKKPDFAIQKLNKADDILLIIGETNPVLKKHTADLIYANSNLISSIKNSSKDVPQAFKKIAIELNLLLNKGELVLDNLEFK